MSRRHSIIFNVSLIFIILISLGYSGIISWSDICEARWDQIIYTLVLCIVLMLMVAYIASIRWAWVFGALGGAAISPTDAFIITCKSYLLAYVLPGQLASEAGRVALSANRNDEFPFSKSTAAVLIDRIFALLALMFSFVSLLVIQSFGYQMETKDIILICLAVLCAATIAFLFIWYGGSYVLRKQQKRMKAVANVLQIGGQFFSQNRTAVALIFLVSVLCNFVVFGVIFIIVIDMFQPARFGDVALMTAASNIGAIIPITPGGLGLSELIFRESGGLLMSNIVSNIAGAYIWFRFINLTASAIGVGIGYGWKYASRFLPVS